MTSDPQKDDGDKCRNESGKPKVPDCRTIGARIRSVARAAAAIHLIEIAEDKAETDTMLETS